MVAICNRMVDKNGKRKGYFIIMTMIFSKGNNGQQHFIFCKGIITDIGKRNPRDTRNGTIILSCSCLCFNTLDIFILLHILYNILIKNSKRSMFYHPYEKSYKKGCIFPNSLIVLAHYNPYETPDVD